MEDKINEPIVGETDPNTNTFIEIKPAVKKKNDFPLIWVILGGCGCCFFLFVLIFAFAFVILGSLFTSTKDVLSTVDNLCIDVNNNRSIKPYFSSSLVMKITYDDELVYSQLLDGCTHVDKIQTLDGNTKNGISTFHLVGDLNYKNNTTKKIDFYFVKEGSYWRISDMKFP